MSKDKKIEKGKKSVILPSGTVLADIEGEEETEITAQISVPAEGGWGWVVVLSSFLIIFVLDGVFFTFGSIFNDMAADLGITTSLVTLANSVAVAVYFMAGPLVSALINRYGFRLISMSGAVVSSMSFLCTYFATDFWAIILFYGCGGGFGACLASMASALVVGFYFEKLRSLAMSIASVGSSVGIMIMFTVNSYIAKLAGWRVVMLLHSGLLGTIYFYSLTFRPLLSLTVTTTVETATVVEETKTVTYLPSLAAIPSRLKADGQPRKEGRKATAAERLFTAVSNSNFPTAATVMESAVPTPTKAGPTPTKAGPSTAATSRFTLTVKGPQGGVSRRQLQEVKSKVISKSRASLPVKDENIEKRIEIKIDVVEEPVKLKWWQKLCRWEEHVSESRPMYRDDAFYEGKLENLPAYTKSRMETAPEDRTGLEYQLAVSRAVTAAELTEKRGVFTTAARRTLATMMDPKLLKSLSFILLCTSGFFTYLGYLVPYVFLPDKNKNGGISPQHCSLFVSVIGFSNAIGRLCIGSLAMVVNPVTLYLTTCLITGVMIMAFNLSFNLYYQYVICFLFGFHVASLSCVRSILIVHLYGLEKLTNATGMMLMFQGLGSLLSTPIAGVLENNFGYTVSFYVAGIFVIISGIVLIPVERLNKKEQDEANRIAQAEAKKDALPDQPRIAGPNII